MNAPIIIVLGYKLNADGVLHPEFILRLDKGLELLRRFPSSYLVITGGRTQPAQPQVSEAAVAAEYLESKLLPTEQGLRNQILLEEEARATADHVRLVRALLRNRNIFPTQIAVVTSAFHAKRSQQIFEYQWPEATIQTVWFKVGNVRLTDAVKECILRGIFYLDPRSTWIMPTLKRVFRNG